MNTPNGSGSFTAGNVEGLYFSNVSVNGALIPEPAHYAAFIGMAAAGVFALRRRRSAKRS